MASRVCKAFTAMYKKIAEMSDLEILITWEALLKDNWHRTDFWSSCHNITMEDWAESILSERYVRGLDSTSYEKMMEAMPV